MTLYEMVRFVREWLRKIRQDKSLTLNCLTAAACGQSYRGSFEELVFILSL
jgi:hypothetical protein